MDGTTADKAFVDDKPETDDVVQGGDTIDNSYATGKTDAVPVLKDEQPVEQPNDQRNPDSDQALGMSCATSPMPWYGRQDQPLTRTEQDEKEAIDKSNILKGDRLRHAKPQGPGYKEPGDTEGLPENDGTSSARAPGAEGAFDNKPGAGPKVIGGAV